MLYNNASVAEKRDELDWVDQDLFDEAIEAGACLENLIDKWQLLATLNGDYSLDKKECDIGELVEGTIRANAHYEGDKKIVFSPFYSLQGKLRLKIEKGLILVALAALIDNAMKYSREGGTVDVLIIKNHVSASIIVADRGVGISFDRQKEIFNAFHAERGSEDQKKSGLSLAIAKRVAELHGGSIFFMSIPGQGARFILKLPLDREDEEKTETALHN
ncbi:MAG: HAMP domain-containing sensor histidine kinase [bacterium]